MSISNLSHTYRLRTNGLLAALFALCLFAIGTSVARAQDSYPIGAGDRLAFRFVYWDGIELRFVQLDALNGTYSVAPDGTIMLPVIGTVQVEGRDLNELADSVAQDLQRQLALVEPPGASISIVEYRPVYVTGAVERPGAYPYAPGLTVQKAIALAGGLNTAVDEGPDGRSAAIRASGSLEELGIEIAREEIRAARLRAEMDGVDDFTAPEEVTHPGGPDAVTAISSHERVLFESRRDALERALASLDDSRTLLETEIAALEEKLARQQQQVSVLRESVGNMEALFERGLVRSPNLVSLQGQLISLENSQLETETAIYRARQSMSEREREKLEIEANRQLEVLRELQRSEAQIEQSKARRNMTLNLLLGAEAMLADTGQGPNVEVQYQLTRNDGDDPVMTTVDAATRLAPSDVIHVRAILDGAGQ